MSDQARKAAAFRALHERPGAFLLPNPWDAGTTRLLEGLGFEALATTSYGLANMLGRRQASPQDMLDNLRLICSETALPVNADLEDGFALEPAEAAKAITLAADCGAVGGSIEDYSAGLEKPLLDFTLSVERVAAAVEAARALPFPFMLTARAENLLYGLEDLDETIRRLQAFEAAGADVLYAPGLYSLEDIRTVTSALTKPLNVVMGFADPALTQEQLAEAGVKRISIGGALSRVALRAFLESAKEMKAGRFGFINDMASGKELHRAFRP